MDVGFSIGGYNIKAWMVAVALPVLSSVAGGVWWSYDTLQRFYGIESGIAEVVDKSASFDTKASNIDKRITTLSNVTKVSISDTKSELVSRIQTLEQAISDNDVRGLNQKLAELSTNMQQILEQQKVLLDLRSQVDKATTITDGLGNSLDTINKEIDDIWDAYDSLADNPLN